MGHVPQGVLSFTHAMVLFPVAWLLDIPPQATADVLPSWSRCASGWQVRQETWATQHATWRFKQTFKSLRNNVITLVLTNVQTLHAHYSQPGQVGIEPSRVDSQEQSSVQHMWTGALRCQSTHRLPFRVDPQSRHPYTLLFFFSSGINTSGHYHGWRVHQGAWFWTCFNIDFPKENGTELLPSSSMADYWLLIIPPSQYTAHFHDGQNFSPAPNLSLTLSLLVLPFVCSPLMRLWKRMQMCIEPQPLDTYLAGKGNLDELLWAFHYFIVPFSIHFRPPHFSETQLVFLLPTCTKLQHSNRLLAFSILLTESAHWYCVHTFDLNKLMNYE